MLNTRTLTFIVAFIMKATLYLSFCFREKGRLVKKRKKVKIALIILQSFIPL